MLKYLNILIVSLFLFFWAPSVEAATINRAPTSAIGLVGYWTFDGKNMGTTSASDLSGQGNTGYLINGPVRASGKIGQALNFDGVNDYVQIAEFPGAEGSQITVSAWVKPSAINSPSAIVAKERSGFTQWEFMMDGNTANNTTNNLQLTVRNTAGTSALAVSDSGVATDLGWHHFVGVYDGQNVYVYGDGLSLDSTPPALTGSINDQPNLICIGVTGGSCNETEKFADGLLDEVRIYNRALTSDEVRTLYNLGR